MTNAFFITGTGTDIGKTFVTCALAKRLQEVGCGVHSIKPVISGWNNDIGCDTMQIITSLGLPHSQENIEKISPWRFKAPLAPSMAASLEGKVVDYQKLLQFCKKSMSETSSAIDGTKNIMLCEGAGGVIVPLTDTKTTLDLMQDLQFPIILVAGTYLGSISHTLTAIKAIEAAALKIQVIIINESEISVGLDSTVNELKKFTVHPIVAIKRINSSSDLPLEMSENIVHCLFE